jgi:hypothetical protein
MGHDSDETFEQFIVATEKLIREGKAGEPESIRSKLEWRKPRYMHCSLVLCAYINGILMADSWSETSKYVVPKNLEGVSNWVAYNIWRKFKTGIVRLSLAEIGILLWRWSNDHPNFVDWSEPNGADGPRVRPRVVIFNALTWLKNELTRIECDRKMLESQIKKQH